MGLQTKHIFVNLPVKDLNNSVTFFEKIGFEFNPQFTDEKSTCMIVGENIFVMLSVEEFFQTITKKEIIDATNSTEAILAISASSREQVNEIVNKALDAGGKSSNDPVDHGFMYSWGFEDIDGHLWEVLYMEESDAAQD